MNLKKNLVLLYLLTVSYAFLYAKNISDNVSSDQKPDCQIFVAGNPFAANERLKMIIWLPPPEIKMQMDLSSFPVTESNARCCELPFNFDSEQAILWYDHFEIGKGWEYKVFEGAPFVADNLEIIQTSSNNSLKNVISVCFISLKKNPGLKYLLSQKDVTAMPSLADITINLKFFNIDKEKKALALIKEIEGCVSYLSTSPFKKLIRVDYQVWGAAKYSSESELIKIKLIFSVLNGDKRYLIHGGLDYFKNSPNSRYLEMNIKKGAIYSVFWLRNGFDVKNGWEYKIFENLPFSMQKITGSCIEGLTDPYVNLRYLTKIKSCCTLHVKEASDTNTTINIKFVNIEQDSKGKDIISPDPLDFDCLFKSGTMDMIFYVYEAQ